jgi:hypothetical protein
MRGPESPRPTRFRRRQRQDGPGRGARWLELLHKLVTGGAALAALLKTLLS